MREVRMTFGEHLEELRMRIIWSLVWLAITTGVSLYFGQFFMDLTLRPHNRAIQGAMNRRIHVRLREEFGRLGEVMAASAEGGRWDLVFTSQIHQAAAQKARNSIGGEFDVAANELSEALESLEEGEREAVRLIVSSLGERVAASIARLTTPQVMPLGDRDYLERFQRLQEDVESIAETFEPNWLQRVLGLGDSFEDILASLSAFNEFLAEREKSIRESYAAMSSFGDVLEAAQAARSSEEAKTTLRSVEDAHDAIRKHVDEFFQDKAQPTIITKYQEGFMSYFKVGLIYGLFFALPLILFEMWRFVGAGLYSHEQKYVLLFLPFSILLFFSGAIFGFFWMVPFGLEFLASWGAAYSELLFSLGSYINLFFTLTILLGLVFQTPLVMIFLYQIGMVTPRGFASVRKYTLLGAVIFSTIVTPPDPLSWSMMAGPIMILYELGIRICYFLDRNKHKEGRVGSQTKTA